MNDRMPKISDYFYQKEKDCIVEIKNIPDVAMLKIDVKEYVNNHYNRYTLKPIQIDELREIRYEKVDSKDAIKVRIYVPVVPNDTIDVTLKYRSNNTYFPQETLYYESNGHIFSNIQTNSEAYERFINDLKREIELLNKDIEKFSEDFRNHLNYHFTVASNIVKGKLSLLGLFGRPLLGFAVRQFCS